MCHTLLDLIIKNQLQISKSHVQCAYIVKKEKGKGEKKKNKSKGTCHLSVSFFNLLVHYALGIQWAILNFAPCSFARLGMACLTIGISSCIFLLMELNCLHNIFA